MGLRHGTRAKLEDVDLTGPTPMTRREFVDSGALFLPTDKLTISPPPSTAIRSSDWVRPIRACLSSIVRGHIIGNALWKFPPWGPPCRTTLGVQLGELTSTKRDYQDRDRFRRIPLWPRLRVQLITHPIPLTLKLLRMVELMCACQSYPGGLCFSSTRAFLSSHRHFAGRRRLSIPTGHHRRFQQFKKQRYQPPSGGAWPEPAGSQSTTEKTMELSLIFPGPQGKATEPGPPHSMFMTVEPGSSTFTF